MWSNFIKEFNQKILNKKVTIAEAYDERNYNPTVYSNRIWHKTALIESYTATTSAEAKKYTDFLQRKVRHLT